MPAVSKSQQRLMGMVHAYKKGDLDLKDLSPSLANKIKSIADGTKRKTGDKRTKTKGISDKDAKHFASTKHKGLPEKVKENVITKFDSFINEAVDIKREDGFYWVKIKNDNEWTVGKYHNTYEDGSDADFWFVIGSDEPYDDTIFDRIGDFIEYKK